MALVLAITSIGSLGSAQAQTAPPRDARNASYWQRIDHPQPDPLQPPYSSYKPLGAIEGVSAKGGPFLPVARPGTASISAPMLDAASQFAEATNAQALIVIHRGVVQLERYYGGATAATPFSSHSFAKTLNALAIGAAIADGRIASVDQPAATWLPEWRDGRRDAITLRHLLTMSGGFRNAPSNDPASHYMQLHYGADVQAAVREAPLAYPPGTDFAWDNDNNQALGLVVARATGVPYADYVSQHLWQPLGAANAEVLFDREGGRAMAYCCIWSLPRDWARVGQMLLDRGRWQGRQVLPAAWVDAMRQPSATNPHFGFQVVLGAGWDDPRLNRRAPAQKASLAPAAAPDLYYLSGAGGLQLAIVPSDELVILRVGKNAEGWREHVLPNLLHTALHPGQPADWSWLYAWRLATRPSVADPWVYAPTKPQFWPTETVTGQPKPVPLPRRLAAQGTTGACLTESTLAPVMAELERVKSYAFLVWRDGAIEVEHYWPESGPGRDGNLRAESASMHKSVLGLVVGQAVADGFIPSLDAPVSRWLTEWAGDPRGAITVRQLLQMASGLAPLKFDMSAGAPASRSQFGPDFAAVPLSQALIDTPGSTFNYGSTVSQLLLLVVERATGQRYAQYLSKRLWRGLGAANAYVTLDRPGGLAKGSGSLLARPEDWLRLGLLFANGGRVGGRVGGRQLIDPAWLAAMSAPSPANPNYGLHLWRASPHNPDRRYNTATAAGVPAKEPFLADDMVYFDGAGAQRVYVSPKERLVIVRLGAPVFDWDDSMVPNGVVKAARGCGVRE